MTSDPILRVIFRLSRDMSTPVAELMERVSWIELMHWIDFYAWEADQLTPPDKRVVRPRNPNQAADAMDRLFRIARN